MDAKGVGKQEMEKGENISQSVESKEEPTGDISVCLPDSKPEERSSSDAKGNPIVRWNLKVRASLKGWLFGKSRMTGIFWKVFLNGVAVALLAASVLQFMKSDVPDPSRIDWCNGVGFLWILYCLAYVGILHFLIKKYFGKSISKFSQPLSNFCASVGANKYFRGICYLSPAVALAAYVIVSPGKTGRRKYSFLGMVVFVFFGYVFSKFPAQIKWRPVISGMALQFAFGLMTIQWETGKNILDCLGNKVTEFLEKGQIGAYFVFGHLAEKDREGGPIFAFSVLPLMFFAGFFVNLLSYYGILQWFILKTSSVVRLAMGTTVCESVNAVSSIFLDMSAAPLLIQRYFKDLTKSEVCAIMCEGWSTVAGIVMAAYIQQGVKASHLIAASVMSAPAALSFSKLLYPETEESKTRLDNIVLRKEEGENALDAASRGALDGLFIAGNIIANIIAILSFVAFLDGTLLWIGANIGWNELSFQFIISRIFYPISFLMGVEEDSLESVAYLVGVKTVVNEFQAYKELGEYIKLHKISERSEIIATYALCGFSNFGSIGISIGVLSSFEPKQRGTITQVALPAFIAANIACFLTACVAGCLIE